MDGLRVLEADFQPTGARVSVFHASVDVVDNDSNNGELFDASNNNASSTFLLSAAAETSDGAQVVDGHDELFYTQRIVVYSCGGRMQSTMTFDEPVLQALWSRMDLPNNLTNSSTAKTTTFERVRVICVLLSRMLHLHFPSTGRYYQLPLPFRPDRIFSLPEGLLVSRKVDPGTENKRTTLPVLFTLTQPLGELRPVGPVDLQCIHVISHEAPLLVMYDPIRHEHSVWLYWWRDSAMASALELNATENKTGKRSRIHDSISSTPSTVARSSQNSSFMSPSPRKLSRVSMLAAAIPTPNSGSDRPGFISPITGRALGLGSEPYSISSTEAAVVASRLRDLQPDMMLQRLWVEPLASSRTPSPRAFCSHNSSGDILLNLLMEVGELGEKSLISLRLGGFEQEPISPSIAPAFKTTNILSAVPVSLTRLSGSNDAVLIDILMLHSSGRLVVYQDASFSYEIAIPDSLLHADVNLSPIPKVQSSDLMDVSFRHETSDMDMSIEMDSVLLLSPAGGEAKATSSPSVISSSLFTPALAKTRGGRNEFSPAPQSGSPWTPMRWRGLQSPMSGVKAASPKVTKVVDLSEPVRDRVLLTLLNGKQTLVRLPSLIPQDSGLAQILDIITQVFPPDLAWTFRLACGLCASDTTEEQDEETQLALMKQSRVFSSWTSLQIALTFFLGFEPSLAMSKAIQHLHEQLGTISNDVAQYVPSLVLSLHILHEEWLVTLSRSAQVEVLRRDVLLPLALHLGWHNFADYYVKHSAFTISSLELKCPQLPVVVAPEPLVSVANQPVVLSIHTFCNEVLAGKHNSNDWTVSLDVVKSLLTVPLRSPLQKTESYASLLPTLFMLTTVYSALKQPQMTLSNLVQLMSSIPVTTQVLDNLPLGVSWALREVLHLAANSPSPDFSAKINQLIGRSDLNDSSQSLQSLLWQPSSADVSSSPSPSSSSSSLPSFQSAPVPLNGRKPTQSTDGTEFATFVASRLRFPHDWRIREVQRLLNSSKHTRLTSNERPELSDHDRLVESQASLALIVQRTLGLSVGRALLTLSTAPPDPGLPLPVPELITTGKTSGAQSMTVTLESNQLNADQLVWPQFHNGVAAGLRLPRNKSLVIDSSWLRYHTPPIAEYNSWAGVLFGLGLNGHIGGHQTYELYALLSTCYDMTSVGVLLGIAASKVGTMDTTTEHMLCLHVPVLLPSNSVELPTPPLVQTAAIFGLGLLYQGTCQRRMTEVFLGEIGRVSLRAEGSSTQSNSTSAATNVGLEAYTLSAGIALGLVALGQGESAAALADLRLDERLQMYMQAGASSVGMAFNEKIGNVYSQSNVNITAPAATLALALIYLKTNNARIGRGILSLPSTSFALDYFRPDLLLLRTMASGLVMWNDISLSKQNVEDRVPSFIRQQMETGPSDSIKQAYHHIIAGGCLLLGLRFAGSASATAMIVLSEYIDYFSTKLQATTGKSADRAHRNGIETCLLMTILSASLVLAGTGDLALLRKIRKLHNYTGDHLYGFHMGLHMALGYLFLSGGTASLCTDNLSIACLVTSLYPRFPLLPTDNRYHLQALRHLHILATEARCLFTVDAATRTFCTTAIRIKTNDQEIRLETSCLLPERSQIQQITVDDESFWPVKVNISHCNFDSTTWPIILVKRRTSAKALQEISSATATTDSLAPAGSMRVFWQYPHLMAFARFLCDEDFTNTPLQTVLSSTGSLADLSRVILRKTLSTSSANHVTLMMAVHTFCFELMTNTHVENVDQAIRKLKAWQETELLQTFHSCGRHLPVFANMSSSCFLLDNLLLPDLISLARKSSSDAVDEDLVKYLQQYVTDAASGSSIWVQQQLVPSLIARLAWVLVRECMPSPVVLTHLVHPHAEDVGDTAAVLGLARQLNQMSLRSIKLFRKLNVL